MKTLKIKLLEWQQRFGTKKACTEIPGEKGNSVSVILELKTVRLKQDRKSEAILYEPNF